MSTLAVDVEKKNIWVSGEFKSAKEGQKQIAPKSLRPCPSTQPSPEESKKRHHQSTGGGSTDRGRTFRRQKPNEIRSCPCGRYGAIVPFHHERGIAIVCLPVIRLRRRQRATCAPSRWATARWHRTGFRTNGERDGGERHLAAWCLRHDPGRTAREIPPDDQGTRGVHGPRPIDHLRRPCVGHAQIPVQTHVRTGRSRRPPAAVRLPRAHPHHAVRPVTVRETHRGRALRRQRSVQSRNGDPDGTAAAGRPHPTAMRSLSAAPHGLPQEPDRLHGLHEKTRQVRVERRHR